MLRNMIGWIGLSIILMIVFNTFWSNGGNEDQIKYDEISYSNFLNKVKNGLIAKVEIDGQIVKAHGYVKPQAWKTINPNDPRLVDDLLEYGIEITGKLPEPREFTFGDFLIAWGPMLLLIFVWIWVMKGMAGGNNMMKVGKSKARLLEEDSVKTTLKDVAGCDEAKERVFDFVDFLKDPDKYTRIGGKIPRGVLMVGPPGTGKTLLAKAIAGEAKVPFFTISGSDFVEMFVGVGASRVRDMFNQAKAKSPCIIFIDEIDGVGRERGAGMGGGHDEREQTLNQLLVEMDGFDEKTSVIVIAATNRPDVLDPALLRPGRFDRQVHVNLPDIKGREQILKVHWGNVKKKDDNVNLKPLAKGTSGFSGADLANLVNEAAILAAKKNSPKVKAWHLEKAKDEIIMGYEKKSMVMDEDEKRLTAYHEAGHCVVGRIVPGHDPVYKVSIMPRGRALGVTMFLPEKDQVSLSKEKAESQLSSLYGGRIAEVIFFGDEKVTTGASNDIERATELAVNMVTKWGLSELMGPIDYGMDPQGDPFAGRQFGLTQKQSLLSDEMKIQINNEIRNFIDRNYERAERIIRENIDVMHTMAEALMKYETIDKLMIDNIMARKPYGEPEGWNDDSTDVIFEEVKSSNKIPETPKMLEN